ncbi:hypothetical protein OGAPHI_004667 [Ogataea philodendri]|uniref:Xylanolytic transcriptional activator regulatory domain-containing protein n=1 Tax=Ogataea philodendri TaxID=1378263 RepID=A0A9P8P183_9ASCO|nr:uncharacterized protein OGAPHI_004667 [Ogataea philodendri]KAH3663953.1 hypothetical protein OGAPHI_004667 [Ogataea philodendri]
MIRAIQQVKENVTDPVKLKEIIEQTSIDFQIIEDTRFNFDRFDDDKSSKTVKSSESDSRFNHVLVTQDTGSSLVLGPTSVYGDMFTAKNEPMDNPIMPTSQSLLPTQLEDLENFRLKYGHQGFSLFYFKPKSKLKYLPIVTECISLFFKWIYSCSFFFIHRESFLYFFLNNESDSEFVSPELINAICALGAKFSRKETIRSQADSFYHLAKSGIFENGDNCFIHESQISKLQTLLCLAMYDLGKGDFTSCWLLSGLAFRMGFELGFELDPKHWNVSVTNKPAMYNKEKLSNKTVARQELYDSYPFDIQQVRSRIFWGSFVVDRFICLVMGRPSTLKLGDTSIPDSQDIGDLTHIENFIYYDTKSDKQYVCRGFHCLKACISLYQISDEVSNSLLRPASELGKLARLDVLSECNLKLLRWKQHLGTGMYWNKSILKSTAHNELCMSHRYTYFIIVLSLNRPFISAAMLKNSTSIDISSSLSICDDIIDDLLIVITVLLTQKAKDGVFMPHILSVYSAILAISCSFWVYQFTPDSDQKKKIKSRIRKCVNFLTECSHIWSLASKPAIIFKKRLDELKDGIISTHPQDKKTMEKSDLSTNFNTETTQNNNENPKETQTPVWTGEEHRVHGRDTPNGTFRPPSPYHDTLSPEFDQIFDSLLNQSGLHPFLLRSDLSDASWDMAFYEKYYSMNHDFQNS